MAKPASNPFQIGIQRNDKMNCFDVVLMIGNLKDKKEAQALCDALSDWMIQDSATAWKQKVQ